MTDYIKTTNFAVKDTLVSGNPSKIVRGSEFDVEFNDIQVAVNSKADLTGAAFTGSVTVTGDITASGAVTASSDARLKSNIVSLQDSLELLSKINGYSYDRVDFEDVRQVGVLAQEVEAVLPLAVDNSKEFKSVNYHALVALLISAVNDLSKKVIELEAK